MDDPDSTDILDAVDRRLDPLVPTGPAPVTDLVRRGRARRTRRRGIQAGLAAAVAIIATTTTTAVVQGSNDSLPAATPAGSTNPNPNPTDGLTRTVGLDGIAVDVPAGWVATEPCNGAEVAFGPPGGTCFSEPSVQIADVRASGFRGGVELRQHGLDVRRYDHVCGPAEDCVYAAWSTVTVEDAIAVTAVTPEGNELRDEIADSVRPVPSGFVAVPDVQGLWIDDAKQVLGDAGLEPPMEQPGYDVAGTDPEAGSVVPLGTAVALSPSLGSDVPDGFREVEYAGVVVAVPAQWVSCPVLAMLGYGPAYAAPDANGDCSTAERVSMASVLQTDTSDYVAAPEQGGLRVRTRTGSEAAAAYTDHHVVEVLAVDEEVIVRIASSSEDLVDTIRRSVRAAD